MFIYRIYYSFVLMFMHEIYNPFFLNLFTESILKDSTIHLFIESTSHLFLDFPNFIIISDHMDPSTKGQTSNVSKWQRPNEINILALQPNICSLNHIEETFIILLYLHRVQNNNGLERDVPKLPPDVQGRDEWVQVQRLPRKFPSFWQFPHSRNEWSDPNQPLITSLPSLVNQRATTRHMHNLGSQSDPPAWPMVDLVQSDRSVFILATLLCTIKVCGPNVLKVVPIQVSNVLCLF